MCATVFYRKHIKGRLYPKAARTGPYAFAQGVSRANGRVWATVIPKDGVKDFRGVTTPLMLVNGDPESEKACSDSLTSVLQLL